MKSYLLLYLFNILILFSAFGKEKISDLNKYPFGFENTEYKKQVKNTLNEQDEVSLKNGEKPNVLFIAIDDLNDWVGCMGGNPQVKTPNLDRLNETGGMVMSKAHCAATVCCPSRSALLTGVHAHKTGVYGNDQNLRYAPKSKDLVTLPEYFSQNGYTTLSMGKIFHRHPIPGDNSGAKKDAGQWAFDKYQNMSGSPGPISDERPVNGLPHLEDENPNNYHYKAFDWGPTKGNDETQMKDYKTAKWAAGQLTDRDFEKPFFMAIGISKPHLTWYVPQKYFDMYPLDEIILPKTISNDLEDILKSNGSQAFFPHDSWRRAEAFGAHKEAVRAYLATITFVDDCIGVLLDGLENSKYADNTIVMLWGDHGWYLGEKMRYGKTQLWQEACRVPFIVKVPGVTPENKRCEGIINLIDMYPTLVELCGLPKNPKNDGRSFAELLHNPDMEWNEPTLTTMGFGNHRVFDGRYSFISHKQAGVEQLYDHQLDSMEWNNIIDDPAYAEVKARLKALVPEYDEPEAPLNKDLKPIAPKDTLSKVWIYPGDTTQAWQYDYVRNETGDTLFSLDNSKTIGIYGCNDTTGFNIRSYADANQFKDAGQFKWDNTAQTFQKNGQWLKFSAKFTENIPYQLLLRTRKEMDANFKLTISDTQGDTVFFKDANLNNDFKKLGDANEHSNWLLSKFPIQDLWGDFTVTFDWYDNIGEPGIFGSFSFTDSDLDISPPQWHYVSIGTHQTGTNIAVITTEDAIVYLVPEGTDPDATSIIEAAVAIAETTAYSKSDLTTSDLIPGNYVIYAIDSSNNISEATRLITLQTPVNNIHYPNYTEIFIAYNAVTQSIQIKSTANLEKIDIYSLLGKKVKCEKCNGKMFLMATGILPEGIYIVQVQCTNGNITRKKITI